MTYAYIRVSTDKQDGANQKLGIEDLCKRKGFTIDEYIDDGVTVSGVTANYNEEDHFMDIRVADSNGDGEEFTEIELPAEGADSIEVVFGYDEVTGTYTATVNAE